MNRLERGLRATVGHREVRNATTVATLSSSGGLTIGDATSESGAMKLSAVNRCVEVLSDSIAKMPIYVMDRRTRAKVDHPLNEILCGRPNAIQTPAVALKMVEANRLTGGNGYLMILRDPRTMRPAQLVPVPARLCQPWLDASGQRWHYVTHPFTGEQLTVSDESMIHVMGYSTNGWKGISVLQRASEVIGAGRAAQQYNEQYYLNGGQPSGVLQTDTDLTGKASNVQGPDGKPLSYRDLIRQEWQKHHGGPGNAGNVAVLDRGLKYSPIAISNKDAQFIEQSELSVQDIARFFGVPLYKLQSGKQSYASNEQNAIEYIVSTLHPIVTQYEEELTYKLLAPSEAKRYRIRMNMMAELRGDFKARGDWYKAMREIGGYSVNDIRALEDMPDVEGGDERYASLNYVPLAIWRQLAEKKNEGGNQK